MILQYEGGHVINIITVVLVSCQLGNPGALSMLPNTIISFFEKTEKFHETYEVDPGTKLYVVNVNGDVDLTVWDEDYVEVNAIKKTNRGEDELTKVQVEVTVGEVMKIRTEYLERNVHVSVDYRIRIPEQVMVQKVATSNGDITLMETSGDTEVMTSNGDIDLKDVVGTVQVQTSNGDIEIRGATVVTEASTSNGDILAEIRQVSEKDTEIATSNGSIDLYVSEKLNADLTSATSMGEVSIKALDLGSQLTARTGSTTTVKGRIGKGGRIINVNTSNGDIRIYNLAE